MNEGDTRDKVGQNRTGPSGEIRSGIGFGGRFGRLRSGGTEPDEGLGLSCPAETEQRT